MGQIGDLSSAAAAAAAAAVAAAVDVLQQNWSDKALAVAVANKLPVVAGKSAAVAAADSTQAAAAVPVELLRRPAAVE